MRFLAVLGMTTIHQKGRKCGGDTRAVATDRQYRRRRFYHSQRPSFRAKRGISNN